MWHWSIGDICTSRYWISFERRPWAWWRWHWSTGPTYNGTVRGFLLCVPCLSVLAHERGLK